jgi:hypothetical protein
VEQVETNPEFELKLDSFHSRGLPHAVFTVLHKEYAEPAIEKIKREYETSIEVLKGKNEQLLAVLDKYIKEPKIQVITGGKVGENINIHSGGDTVFAKDEATASIVKINIQAANDLFNKISEAIKKSNSSYVNKEKAKKQLDKIGKELKKEKPDKVRLERCWSYIVKAIPKVAKVVPWKKTD